MPSVRATNDGVEVSYLAREEQHYLTKPEYRLIKGLAEHKTACVMFVRCQYGLSLLEAKRIVDTIHAMDPL